MGPADTPARFAATDTRGRLVELRRPRAGELLCGGCLGALLHGGNAEQMLPDTDFPADLAAALADIGAELAAEQAADALANDPVAALFPGSGEPGHDCTQSFPGPVWLLRDAGCTADTIAHLHADLGCDCGRVELFDALEHLADGDRQAAIDAHVDVMNELYDHLMLAEALGDDATTGAADQACLACLLDRDFHVNELDEDIQVRAMQLPLVLRAYRIRLTCAGPRPAGPVSEAA